MITKNDRPTRVANFDYGMIFGTNSEQFDKPVYAVLSFSDIGELIGADYSKLDEFIETHLIANDVRMKKFKNPYTKEVFMYPSIQLNKIVEAKLSEIEFQYVIDYLEQKNIRIGGYSHDPDSEFINYDYSRTYKSNNFKKPVSAEEEFTLFKEYSETKNIEIRNKIIEHNLRLVPYVAYNIALYTNEPLEDLISEGNIALIELIDKFDYTKGFRFSTYAVTSLKRRILNSIYMRNSNYGASFVQKIMSIVKAIEKTNQTTIGKNPELIEDVISLASNYFKELNSPNPEVREEFTNRIRNLINLDNHLSLDTYGTPEEKTKTSIDFSNDSFLDETADEENKGLEIYDDDSSFTAMDYVYFEQLCQKINEVLDTLTPRQKNIIEYYFGLGGKEKLSYREIGYIYGLSGERIRQIFLKAMRKLQHPSRTEVLKAAIEDGDTYLNNNSFTESNISEIDSHKSR